MNNQRLAAIFYDMADILDIQGIPWKPIAYRKAARNIETLKDDVADILKRGGIEELERIPGIGEAIAKKSKEFIDTGTIHEYERLRSKLPKGLTELMSVRGMGPKRTRILWKRLKITTVDQLEAACKSHRLQKLAGFGEKSEQDLLDSIALWHRGHERVSIGMALPIGREIASILRRVPGVQQVELGGSVRRMRETVKDIDILVVAKNAKSVLDAFTSMPGIAMVTGKGETKSSVVLEQGLPVDVRVLPPKSFGAALQYFTGNKEHNVRTRQIALSKGLTLSEYGLFTVKGKKFVAGRTEQEIYKRLGLPYPEPELRENSGELDVKKLPALVGYDALRGDLQTHTSWSDGNSSAAEMLDAASGMGYDYLAITDHSVSERQANGMDEKRFKRYLAELRKLQAKLDSAHGIHLFVGSEVDILSDGSLDYSKKLLDQLDIVVASVHSGFKMESAAMTKRIVKALDSGSVHVLSHPTARLIGQREPIQFDLDAVCDAAKANKVLLEINASPLRLDLNDVMARHAAEQGCAFVISTDSHHPDQLRFAEFGIGVARRAWLEPRHIANTLPLKRFEKLLQR
jgi:DNA polymerase (family 10)